MRKSGRITAKQAQFCREYLVDLNGAAAARRAGYSPRTADQIAINLVGKSWVSEEINRLLAERARSCSIDADGVLERLLEEANADLADLFDGDGNIKPVHEWPTPWKRGLVTGLEVETITEGRGENKRPIGKVTRVKFSDRIRRLELIGKHASVGAFRDKVQLETADPLADLLREIAGRTFGPKEP